ncbi:hypothetical protein Fcan01_19212 [Folsomia candida]|uniref:Uncharacterized protein n=1 Tax=Folsomia candida TaxID=158441 RepID=A0A226DPA4_FOLCA|nr:hypothetical protein Fcan01_19212 [Folsomia candida]
MECSTGLVVKFLKFGVIPGCSTGLVVKFFGKFGVTPGCSMGLVFKFLEIRGDSGVFDGVGSEEVYGVKKRNIRCKLKGAWSLEDWNIVAPGRVKEQVWSTSLMPNPLISMPLTSIISYKQETMLQTSFVTTSSEISLFSVANRFIIGQHIASSHTLGPHNFGATSIGQSLPSARNFPISTSRPQIEVVPHTFGATSLGQSLQPATPFPISTSPPQNEVVAPHHDIILSPRRSPQPETASLSSPLSSDPDS